MAAWVERLDDKELICFSCHNLFPYFDPMSRMAVWKEQLGGIEFIWLVDSDVLSSKALGWDRRRWAQRRWLRRR